MNKTNYQSKKEDQRCDISSLCASVSKCLQPITLLDYTFSSFLDAMFGNDKKEPLGLVKTEAVITKALITRHIITEVE